MQKTHYINYFNLKSQILIMNDQYDDQLTLVVALNSIFMIRMYVTIYSYQKHSYSYNKCILTM